VVSQKGITVIVSAQILGVYQFFLQKLKGCFCSHENKVSEGQLYGEERKSNEFMERISGIYRKHIPLLLLSLSLSLCHRWRSIICLASILQLEVSPLPP
jgi:hypothetical protein